MCLVGLHLGKFPLEMDGGFYLANNNLYKALREKKTKQKNKWTDHLKEKNQEAMRECKLALYSCLSLCVWPLFALVVPHVVNVLRIRWPFMGN